MTDKDCLLCGKFVDDYGNNFCNKCHNKDWKLRFLAIKEKEREKGSDWKTKRKQKESFNKPQPFFIKNYWQRRRQDE